MNERTGAGSGMDGRVPRKGRATGRSFGATAHFQYALLVTQITPAEVQKRLSCRLRTLIGRGRPMTLKQAALATDISERTLKAYMEGRACPNLARYGRLLRVFGPEVGIELAMMIGWEPRAASPQLPHAEQMRALRDAIAQAIRAVDLVIAQGRESSLDPPLVQP